MIFARKIYKIPEFYMIFAREASLGPWGVPFGVIAERRKVGLIIREKISNNFNFKTRMISHSPPNTNVTDGRRTYNDNTALYTLRFAR